MARCRTTGAPPRGAVGNWFVEQFIVHRSIRTYIRATPSSTFGASRHGGRPAHDREPDAERQGTAKARRMRNRCWPDVATGLGLMVAVAQVGGRPTPDDESHRPHPRARHLGRVHLPRAAHADALNSFSGTFFSSRSPRRHARTTSRVAPARGCAGGCGCRRRAGQRPGQGFRELGIAIHDGTASVVSGCTQ